MFYRIKISLLLLKLHIYKNFYMWRIST